MMGTVYHSDCSSDHACVITDACHSALASVGFCTQGRAVCIKRLIFSKGI